MYTISEFTKAAQKLFGLSGALVKTALKETGRDKFSIDEAKLIVEAFANREVKNK